MKSKKKSGKKFFAKKGSRNGSTSSKRSSVLIAGLISQGWIVMGNILILAYNSKGEPLKAWRDVTSSTPAVMLTLSIPAICNGKLLRLCLMKTQDQRPIIGTLQFTARASDFPRIPIKYPPKKHQTDAEGLALMARLEPEKYLEMARSMKWHI